MVLDKVVDFLFTPFRLLLFKAIYKLNLFGSVKRHLFCHFLVLISFSRSIDKSKSSLQEDTPSHTIATALLLPSLMAM